MKKRIYTSIAIVITLALLFVLKVYVSDYFFDVFFAVIACFATFEMSKLLTKMGKYNYGYVALVFPALLLAGNLIGIHYCALTKDLFWILYTILIDLAIIVFVGLILFVWGIIFRRRRKNEISVREIKNTTLEKFSFHKALNTLVCFVYPAFLFLFFNLINHFGELPLGKVNGIGNTASVFILLTAILIPMITDTFAMLVGSVIGGKKLCPNISAGKTISGAIGGILWCVVFGICVYVIFGCINEYTAFLDIYPLWAQVIVTLLGSVVSQAGDILESVVKRRAGVKDSGRILPGHGGMLDRIDSYILIAPFVFILFWVCLI